MCPTIADVCQVFTFFTSIPRMRVAQTKSSDHTLPQANHIETIINLEAKPRVDHTPGLTASVVLLLIRWSMGNRSIRSSIAYIFTAHWSKNCPMNDDSRFNTTSFNNALDGSPPMGELVCRAAKCNMLWISNVIP